MIEQLSDESRSIIFMKNIRVFLKRLFFNFGEKKFGLLMTSSVANGRIILSKKIKFCYDDYIIYLVILTIFSTNAFLLIFLFESWQSRRNI